MCLLRFCCEQCYIKLKRGDVRLCCLKKPDDNRAASLLTLARLYLLCLQQGEPTA